MNKKIIGYWHLWMVNHFADIVKEQLKYLVDSGLYDALDTLHICCLGEYEKFLYLQKIIEKYPKIKIGAFETDNTLYEFVTLNLLKDHADKAEDDYYVFYFHSKGVSFSKSANETAFRGGGIWRNSMNYWTIERWKDNVEKLDDGYETVGTQLRIREFPTHYSGSYFWSKTEYIKLLPPVYSLDMNNRMESEFWLFKATPIAATLNQTYTDYYTSPDEKVMYPTYVKKPPIAQQGLVTPLAPSKKQSRALVDSSRTERNIVHTICYAPPEEVERAVGSLYELNDKADFIHCIIDREFPLLHHHKIPDNIPKQKKENTEFLKELANKYGSKYLKFVGEGVSQSWAFVAKAMNVDIEDVIVSCDPDEVCINKGWVRALTIPLRSKFKFGATALVMKDQLPTLNAINSKEINVEGIRLIQVEGDAMWATCAISGDVYKTIGGIPYPEQWNIYGGLESAINNMMKPHGFKWGFTADYFVEHPEWDFTHYLRQWKHFVLSQNAKEQMKFEEFLEHRKSGKISDAVIKKLATR